MRGRRRRQRLLRKGSVCCASVALTAPHGLFVSQEGNNANPSSDQVNTNLDDSRWGTIAAALIRSITRPTARDLARAEERDHPWLRP
jgi:hypothetical protein